MSEKRFELRGLGVFDTENDNKSLSRVDVVDLLNSLNGDNEHLEEYCGDLESDVKRFKEENEQLKQELNECANHKLYSRRKLEKENKELKQQLDKIPKNIREVWK